MEVGESGRLTLGGMFFEWEVDIWKDFMSTVEGVIPMEGMRDRVVWATSSSERFTCKSFRRSIARVGIVLNKWKLLWELSVHLKVKCFD